MKLLSRALAIRGRNQWGVHVEEPPLVEEGVRGVGHGVAQALSGRIGAGAGAQVRDLAHVLEGVALLAQRVLRASHSVVFATQDRTQ